MFNIAFIGNPNAGKSTWINYLCDSHLKVANYLGVSVQAESTTIMHQQEKMNFVDLPGIYDLYVQSGEETYTKTYLDTHHVDLLVNVIDIRDVQRSLHLTSQLKKLSIPLLVLLNYVDDSLDQKEMLTLSEMLKLPILFSGMQQKEDILDTLLSLKKSSNQEKISMYEIEKLQLSSTKKKYGLDDYLLHPILGIPLLIVILIFSIFIVYVLTTPIGEWITLLSEIGSGYVLGVIPQGTIFYSVLQAICFTFTSMLSFMPFLFGIFILLSFLEESGYIARIAYLLDGAMRLFHLSGRSVIPLLIGFGCNVPAIMATRTIDNKKEKVICALMIPFVSCSAKLPIFLLFVSVFFKDSQVWIIVLLYAISILVSLFIGAFFSNKQTLKSVFILELPSYALPNIKVIWNKASKEIQHFIKKVGKVMVISMIVLTFIFPFINNQSYQRIYTPLGFSQSRDAVESIPFGLLSKENLVVYFSQKKGNQELPSYIANLWDDPNQKLKALCFLLFLAMSIPCVMTLASIKSEFGYSIMGLSIVIMFVVSYVVSYCAYAGVLFLQSVL